MTISNVRDANSITGVPVRRISARVAFYLQVSIAVFFLAGSSAPTPLYSLYQAQWHFSPITTTVVFGVYAIAVLAALLIAGSLSDHVGRRPVLIIAVLAQAMTMLVFATADGVPALMAARIAQGLSTGAAMGAIGAGLLDLNRTKGTIANAVGPLTGTALGGIGSGLLAQYLPAPTRLVYLVLFAIFVTQAIGVVLMAESSPPRPGALRSLRPQIALPSAVRRPMLVAAPALVAVWALAGFYGSLGPSLIHRMLGGNTFLLGGIALSVLAGSGAITVLVMRSAAAQRQLMFGTTALFVGVGLTLVGIASNSVVALFAGMLVAGSGFGAGFQGAIRTVVPLAAAHERAGVLSLMYVISYLAMGLPAVIAGLLVVHGGGVLATSREYASAVMVLAVIALLGVVLGVGRVEQAVGNFEDVSAAIPDQEFAHAS